MTRGYQALREHSAWLDLSARGKIRVSGEDRARLLHAMTTNHVQQLKPGDGCYAFFLNAQGRILGDVNLFCFEDHFLLDTEPETRQKLFEHLDRYIIADDVILIDETDRMATIAIEGPAAQSTLAQICSPIPGAAYHTTMCGERTVARVDSTGSGGFFLFTPLDDKSRLIRDLEQAGASHATFEDATIVRLENGRPRYGEEITERFLVQETGQLEAVSFNKGCYLGQEIVERVRSRAQIHRILRRLEIESTEVPPAGTKFEGGEIVSAVLSPALGKAVAMAYVKTANSEPGTELTVAGAPARVT
ncbi:MAG TPA: glycine cleavage T C-terminal barrel domain-containing protein [Bryobacteraceae bacterium]|jgi:folate-binding protein YgfZ|nr:glycine cleavage T C-terminal barrel domain-containing protein [Bryobacteraceae bacterium]